MTVDTNLERQPKQQKLRNAEYYDMQDVMDKLYEESCKGKSFHKLMHIITSENNILLAFRNIKNNKGSMTKGTDGKTITQYKVILSILVYTFFSRMFDLMLPPVAKHSIVVA